MQAALAHVLTVTNIDLDTSCRDVFAPAWRKLKRHFRLAPVGDSPAGRFRQFRLGERRKRGRRGG